MDGKYDPQIAIKIDNPLDIIPKEVIPRLSDLSKRNPVSNTRWDYLFFNDSKVFSPAAIAFRKNKSEGNPCYTTAIPGTTQYRNYWVEERNRCINGYTVGGVYITGEHYFYLNYCLIEKKVTLPSGRQTKQLDFPDFTTLDYYWFLELELRENPSKYNLPDSEKKSIILAKARRKGWSF